MADASSITTPHFAFPIQMQTQSDGTLAVAVNEQDSLPDILACVQMIVACPIGAWVDQTSFGIPSPLFAQAPVQTAGITQAISRWEPRAVLNAQESPDAVSDAVRDIQIAISGLTADQ